MYLSAVGVAAEFFMIRGYSKASLLLSHISGTCADNLIKIQGSLTWGVALWNQICLTSSSSFSSELPCVEGSPDDKEQSSRAYFSVLSTGGAGFSLPVLVSLTKDL